MSDMEKIYIMFWEEYWNIFIFDKMKKRWILVTGDEITNNFPKKGINFRSRKMSIPWLHTIILVTCFFNNEDIHTISVVFADFPLLLLHGINWFHWRQLYLLLECIMSAFFVHVYISRHACMYYFNILFYAKTIVIYVVLYGLVLLFECHLLDWTVESRENVLDKFPSILPGFAYNSHYKFLKVLEHKHMD